MIIANSILFAMMKTILELGWKNSLHKRAVLRIIGKLMILVMPTFTVVF